MPNFDCNFFECQNEISRNCYAHTCSHSKTFYVIGATIHGIPGGKRTKTYFVPSKEWETIRIISISVGTQEKRDLIVNTYIL